MRKNIKFIDSTRFANITSLLALIFAIFSIYFTWKQTRDLEQFSLVMSEGMIIQEDIHLTKKDSLFFLSINLPIFVTNKSGINQPITRIDLNIGEKRIWNVKNIMDLNMERYKFPININAKESIGLIIPAEVQITKKQKELISKYFKVDNDSVSTNLGTYNSFTYRLENTGIKQELELFNTMKTKIKVEIFFLTASDNSIGILDYPFLIPN